MQNIDFFRQCNAPFYLPYYLKRIDKEGSPVSYRIYDQVFDDYNIYYLTIEALDGGRFSIRYAQDVAYEGSQTAYYIGKKSGAEYIAVANDNLQLAIADMWQLLNTAEYLDLTPMRA